MRYGKATYPKISENLGLLKDEFNIKTEEQMSKKKRRGGFWGF
jgi:hypothetical protein